MLNIIHFVKIKDNILTRAELANVLGVSRQTLSNWEKDDEKKELIRLINQGLAFDKLIEDTEKNLEKMKQIKEYANDGKFHLK